MALGPIQMPDSPEKMARESLVRQLASIERLIGNSEAVAAMAQTPQWPALRDKLTKLVEKYQRDIVREDDPPEIYRLQGAIRALSDLTASPEEAVKVVTQLRAKYDEIRRRLGQG